MNDEQWQVELRLAERTVQRVFRERDPDVIADALARYWYDVQILGRTPGRTILRYAWFKARVGERFPGTPSHRGRTDALPFARRLQEFNVSGRRTPKPDHEAVVREEVRFALAQARSAQQTAILIGEMEGKTYEEMGRETGRMRQEVYKMRRRLFNRIRKARALLK